MISSWFPHDSLMTPSWFFQEGSFRIPSRLPHDSLKILSGGLPQDSLRIPSEIPWDSLGIPLRFLWYSFRIPQETTRISLNSKQILDQSLFKSKILIYSMLKSGTSSPNLEGMATTGWKELRGHNAASKLAMGQCVDSSLLPICTTTCKSQPYTYFFSFLQLYDHMIDQQNYNNLPIYAVITCKNCKRLKFCISIVIRWYKGAIKGN